MVYFDVIVIYLISFIYKIVCIVRFKQKSIHTVVNDIDMSLYIGYKNGQPSERLALT